MTALDPISLQVTTGALRAACDEMGAVLIRSAHSANIKERHDCSTALFDPAGEMVMQAEHIPVHLGAMPASVAEVLHEDHAPGRSWILNDPYRGGTHLPDITVITPAFTAGGQLLGFAASRAHHADVGARVPGSMPADSTTLAEEGVVIAPRVLDDAAIDELAARMRQPAQRRADLRAQLAANRAGCRRLVELAERIGPAALHAATSAVMDYAERRARACLAALPDGVRTARDVLEAAGGDVELVLRATVDGDVLRLDFTGSAPMDPGNLNCPLAVTRSACIFALRVLTDPDIPPSAGAHRPLEVIVPEGTLLNARAPAAVAAGNVETSSRVADLVLAAFGRALGQGTMNNLTLGTEEWTYYETIGGGQGACPDADGPSGVHVAMSNTLNTPVEALEQEFPLLVTEYAVRRGSGGDGAFRGGDGVVREVQALEPMTYSLITERRRHAPPGAAGGTPGAVGRNVVDGLPVEPKATGTLEPGMRLRIETPGGGGHGTPPDRPATAPAPAPARPMTRVGFLGLGIMGSRMAANLAAAGHPLTVWTHTPGKAAAWAAGRDGVTAVDTPAAVGAACDVAITVLVDGDQVRATLLGPDGVLDGAGPGVLCVDMSTIGARAAREIGAEVAARGGRFVDAPVTGSSPKAEAGTLTIMAGGEAGDVARARPLFDAMGELFVHVGGAGQGQMLKLINNAVAAANAATVAQALVAADATGLDLQDVVTVLGAGAGGSTMLDLKAGPMREHDYTTLFKLDHMLKDVRLCLAEADEAGVPFPAAAEAAQALVAARHRGFGEADFAAVVEAFEGLAGRRL